MLRITLRITHGQQRLGRIGTLVIAPILAILLVGSLVVLQEPTVAQEAHEASVAEVAYLPTSSGRHVYLTKVSYKPSEAKSACAAGYRMASFWEIYDISNVIYDYNHPQAYVKADSGQGPPSYWHGWVRTGYDSSGSDTTGTGNCLNWTSSSAGDYGVSVRLSRTWETAPGDIGTWDANKFTCNISGPVWCVTDIMPLYLPLMLR